MSTSDAATRRTGQTLIKTDGKSTSPPSADKSEIQKGATQEVLATFDASVKSTLPPRFWSVAVVFAAFFGLLAVAPHLAKMLPYFIFSLRLSTSLFKNDGRDDQAGSKHYNNPLPSRECKNSTHNKLLSVRFNVIQKI